ncbi:MAG: hypothetical protein FRX49_12339 [Trebouxia sp. A1-2]|nr:MAG: hypothetical protein FRX49_12339 [Trebouxia sp. A1-2]
MMNRLAVATPHSPPESLPVTQSSTLSMERKTEVDYKKHGADVQLPQSNITLQPGPGLGLARKDSVSDESRNLYSYHSPGSCIGKGGSR